MEESDNIIIHSLRQIGCDIGEDITSLSSFSVELIVEAVVKCLKTIKPELDVSPELQPNLGARLKIGTELAEHIKDLDYKGTIGYQIFIYSSDASELRRLFPFLIEKFPKEDEIQDTSLSKASLLGHSVAQALSENLAEPWLPHYCHKEEAKFTGKTKVPYNSIRLDVPSKLKKNIDIENYYKNYQKSVPDQVKHRENLLPAILSYNAKLLYSHPTNIIDRLDWISSQQEDKTETIEKSSALREIPQDIPSQKSDNEVLPPKVPELESPKESSLANDVILTNERSAESTIERISIECENLRLSIEKEQSEVEKINSKMAQITLVEQSEQQELVALQEQKSIIQRSYDLLSDGEVNIEKLERVIETKRCKLINLATEWEEKRKPLYKKYREQREKNSRKTKADEMRMLREKQRELDRELKNKEEQYIQLANEVQKVSTNRSAYTQRILEIINNIRKQKDEIEKVIEDTRDIKKEINNLTGRIERSYDIAKELCQYSNARSLLVTLHTSFNSLIYYVEKTGAVIRKIRDLEEQIDNESAKNVKANLERIRADLVQMKQENEDLETQWREEMKVIHAYRKKNSFWYK